MDHLMCTARPTTRFVFLTTLLFCCALFCLFPVNAFAQENDAKSTEGTQVYSIGQSRAPSSSGSGSDWVRLGGETALGTMQSIVQEGWSSSQVVVIATRASFRDAIVASPLAGYHKAPILLTEPHRLSPETRAEISRLNAKTAYIVGGEKAISRGVEEQLAFAGCAKVVRIGGGTAAETAAAVADHLSGVCSKTCIVATEASYRDALSIAPYAYKSVSPIYLTSDKGKSLSVAAKNSMAGKGFSRAMLLGSTSAVDDSVESAVRACGVGYVERVMGQNGIGTSSAIAKWSLNQGMSAAKVGVATSLSFRDALTGAALCGKNNAPMLLISDSNRSVVYSYVNPRRSRLKTAYIFGSERAVSAASEDLLKSGTAKAAYSNLNDYNVDGFTKLGIDVSSWQGWINWQKVKDAGIDFAIVRVAHGVASKGYTDSYYMRNLREAKAAGIELGVYIYSDATTVRDARSEADNVIRLLSAAGFSPSDLPLGVYYDLEEPELQSISKRSLLLNMTKAFTARMKAGGYKNLGVYANLYWWTTFLPSSEYNQWNRWIAQYNDRCNYTGTYKMWQFRSTGRVDGISGNVDMNLGYW